MECSSLVALALVCGSMNLPPTVMIDRVTPVIRQTAGCSVIFDNADDGYQFEVPPGWKVTPIPSSGHQTIYIARPIAGPNDWFSLKICPGPTPEECIGDDGMLASLVRVADIRMAGHPAKEYYYDRQTVSGSRVWKEVVSVLNYKGTTYGLRVQIPTREVEAEYLEIYRKIRDSFQLTRP